MCTFPYESQQLEAAAAFPLPTRQKKNAWGCTQAKKYWLGLGWRP